MLNKIVFSVLMLIYFPTLATEFKMNCPPDNDKTVTEALSYISKIQSFAQKTKIHEYTNDEIANEVKNIIPTNMQSKLLWKVGIISGTLYSGNACDILYDEIYFQVQEYCAFLLAGRCDHSSKHYLSLMKSLFGWDAGGSVYYNDLLEHQSEKCK